MQFERAVDGSTQATSTSKTSPPNTQSTNSNQRETSSDSWIPRSETGPDSRILQTKNGRGGGTSGEGFFFFFFSFFLGPPSFSWGNHNKVEKEREAAESFLGATVTGTLYGQRKGRVTFCVQGDSRSAPLLLLEFAMPTHSLVREMSSGLLRIALECKKNKLGKDLKAGGLFAEPVWTMFCNGRKVGLAIKRQFVDADREVLGLMQSVTMGAGVIPAVAAAAEEGSKGGGGVRDSSSDEEIMYMRAQYERGSFSADNLSFHMINPNGSQGQELSIFFIRV
ncbi:unnamed protein product [Sphagnum balticum]